MALDKEIFKENGIQFVARYIYDSGEVSAIGPISSVLVAQQASTSSAHLVSPSAYEVNVGTSHPTYAKYLDVYARVGNEGIFRRCKTIDLSLNPGVFTFTGELFEALESAESTKLFDTVPFETKTIEVANNRVFLGNNKDDFDNDAPGIRIKVEDSATTLTDSLTATEPISYLRYDDDTTLRVSGYANNPYANASQYKIGVAFYDEYLRTRGVEVATDFETGNFTYPIYPKITVTRDGSFPSWAKYYQLVITKNLTKDFSYEGYASGYWWEIKNGVENDMQYIKDSYRGDIKYMVLDISGMIQAGYTYTYQADDRINVNLSATDGSKIIRNMKVVGQSDNFIYVEWTNGESFGTSMFGNNPGDSHPSADTESDYWRCYFEIYSPRSLEDVQLYYETGELRTLAADFPNNGDAEVFDITSNPLVGDMVFHNVPIKVYRIETSHNDDHVPEIKLDLDVNVLIRKVNGTTRNSNWDINLGKVLAEYDGQSRQRSKSKIKYGGKYIQGTNINPISSFSFVQEAEVPYENGAITSLKRASKVESDGDIMLAICERETASLYIGEAVLSGTTGDGFVSTTQSVIGTVRNLKGGFGSSHRRSVVQYAGNIYFWDNNKKKVMRYGADGLTPISDYFMKSYFLGKSGDCLGFYDPYYDTYHIQFDSDTKSVGFHEGRNRWISFYDITSQAAETREENMLLFKTSGNNVVYYESLQSDYTEFFGTEKDADITYVMNTQLPEVLKNIKIYTNMDIYDYNNANDVKSELIRVDIDNENGQSTELVEANYLAEERVLYSHILRDSGSTGGLVSGDHVAGSITDVKLTLRNNDIQTRLNNVIIETDLSSGHLS